MREGIHPDYPEATVSCSCGAVYKTHSTKGDYQLDICSNCHPFYTGQQKLVDTQGRVERFRNRYAKRDAQNAQKK